MACLTKISYANFELSKSDMGITEQDLKPFVLWKEGINFDLKSELQLSYSKFMQAAQKFFDMASSEENVAKALFEYSTLMDAFCRTQLGRLAISINEFDEALSKFNEATQILRSTAHFGFLAPFISACATTETTDKLEKFDPEKLQGYRNAIALYEQSKIALSFRDEYHPISTVIDAYIRYCISQALLLESSGQAQSGDQKLSEDTKKRSELIMKEFKLLALRAGVPTDRLLFLPPNDYRRVEEGSFIVTYPDKGCLWLLNLGTNPAIIDSIGSKTFNEKKLEPRDSLGVSEDELEKGKIRLIYRDMMTGRKFDEGCLLHV